MMEENAHIPSPSFSTAKFNILVETGYTALVVAAGRYCIADIAFAVADYIAVVAAAVADYIAAEAAVAETG